MKVKRNLHCFHPRNPRNPRLNRKGCMPFSGVGYGKPRGHIPVSTHGLRPEVCPRVTMEPFDRIRGHGGNNPAQGRPEIPTRIVAREEWTIQITSARHGDSKVGTSTVTFAVSPGRNSREDVARRKRWTHWLPTLTSTLARHKSTWRCHPLEATNAAVDWPAALVVNDWNLRCTGLAVDSLAGRKR